jgi:hypothetical protein
MANLTISYYLEKLITDPSFSEIIESQIDELIKDCVIGITDIPKIVSIIIESIQTRSTIVIKQNILGDTIKNMILFLIRRYNVNITDEELKTFIDVIDSSLKLLLTIPVLKNSCC